MMDLARHDLAVAAPAAMAPSVDTAWAWRVALGLSFIGCGVGLGLALVAIGAAGPLAPAQADQLWMMSFGLLFVVVVGAALTGSGLGDWRTDSGTFFSAAFVLLILAPSTFLRHDVRGRNGPGDDRLAPVPNFFVYRRSKRLRLQPATAAVTPVEPAMARWNRFGFRRSGGTALPSTRGGC
jgi:hypothetical protein